MFLYLVFTSLPTYKDTRFRSVWSNWYRVPKIFRNPPKLLENWENYPELIFFYEDKTNKRNIPKNISGLEFSFVRNMKANKNCEGMCGLSLDLKI